MNQITFLLRIDNINHDKKTTMQNDVHILCDAL